MSASGNEATSFNSPPSALTYSRSVLTDVHVVAAFPLRDGSLLHAHDPDHFNLLRHLPGLAQLRPPLPAAPETPSRRRAICPHIAYPVEDHGRKVGASGLDHPPIMPAGGKVLIFAEFRFFQVVGERIGQLHLQLLER